MIGWVPVGPPPPIPPEVKAAVAKAIDNILTHTNIPPALAAKGEGMIPVGNWEDTIDELQNDVADLEEERDELQLAHDYLVDENAELKSALNAADTDIADYLFELDHLREEHGELKQDVEGLLLLVEYWQGRADEFEVELVDRRNRVAALKADRISLRSQVEELGRENDELRNELDDAVNEANRVFSLHLQSTNSKADLEIELEELKAALRTLGGEKEN